MIADDEKDVKETLEKPATPPPAPTADDHKNVTASNPSGD